MIALPVTCPVFIGREAELAALNDARRDLAKSRGSFVTIAGEAGIGKSRLVRQFVARSGDRRVRSLAWAECAPHATGPFAPLRTLVESLLGAGRPQQLSERAERAVAHLKPGDALPGPHIERSDLFDGVLDLLASFAAKRSTILIIEDCHWADTSTLEFLAVLAPRMSRMRLLIIATCRMEEVAADAARLALFARIEREPSHRRIALDPFAPDVLRTLLVAALEGRAPAGESTLNAIAVRSEGNPFFAEELLKESLSTDRARAARLPVSIRGIFAERFASLAPATQRVLSTAAVFGVRFHPHLLALIVACSIDDLVAPLKAARDAALVVEDPDERGALRFRHALIRDAIVEELLVFDLQRLHQRILEALERTPDAPLYALAEHAAAAGDRARTFTYGERAGEAAWALGGYAEAIASFERALAASNDADRARIMERLAFPVSYNGDVARALQLWETALALNLARGAYSAAARLQIIMVCERFAIGDVADEGESLLTFVRDHGAALTMEQRDRIHVLIACLRSELAHFATVDDLLNRIEDAGRLPPDVTQQIFLAKTNRAAHDGDVSAWRTQLAGLRSLASIHEIASVEALNVSDHLASIVVSGLYLGVNAELEAALERGRSLAVAWKFERFVTHYDALEAAYLCTLGRFSDAAARFAAAPGTLMHLTSSLFARTAPWLQLALDDDTFAAYTSDATMIERERRAVRTNAQSQHSRIFIGGYALCLARAGRHEEAARDLATAFAGIERPSPRFAGLLAFALRTLPVNAIPHLAVFANPGDLLVDDAVGHAMANLARAALDANPALFAHAADAFLAAGFACIAAHAYHLAGMTAQAQELYAQCGATAYLAARAPKAILANGSPQLSQREFAVARYVADGFTNQAIAERLSVSKKTVEKYLASIFRKYDLRSRSQIATRLRDVLLERI